nr:uncharacterized protein LOC123285781 [Equus asinus]
MLFTETAHFVVNFLLSRQPRATTPHRLDQVLCFWGCRGPVLPAPASRRSLADHWLSPQRRAAGRRLLLAGAQPAAPTGGHQPGQPLRSAPAPPVEAPVAEY